MPTHNRARLLPKAIDSVLAQTFSDFELIVVDDHSSDETSTVLANYCDPRIRSITNSANLRLPATLNVGFQLARGELLTWTSDDNMYHEQALERMVAKIREESCHFVYADYWSFGNVDADGNPSDSVRVELPDHLMLDRCNQVGACFLFTRTVYERVGEYDPDLFLVEDYDYWIRVSQFFRMVHIPEPLYHYRLDDSTLTASRTGAVLISDALLRFQHQLISEHEVLNLLVRLIARTLNTTKTDPNKLGPTLLRMGGQKNQVLMRARIGLLRIMLQRRVRGICAELATGSSSFGVARDDLCRLARLFGVERL